MIWAIMAVYQIVIFFVDLVYLLFQCLFLFLLSIYHFFDPPKMKSVAGEIILVTGAGHGIGKELCLQFARLGAKVVCLDINEEWNRETVAQITKEGGSAWAFWCDVSKREEIKAVSDKIRRVIGEVTILVNNAAIMPCKPFAKHTPEDIEKLFSVNVYSHFWTLMEWLPTFMENGRGHVVAMSSLCGVMGTANLAPYCSSKFAITGIMEGLSEELRYGYQYPNIKLTRVHPFVVNTGLALKPRIRRASSEPKTLAERSQNGVRQVGNRETKSERKGVVHRAALTLQMKFTDLRKWIFPSWNPVVSPEDCANLIIQSVRREEEIVYIPYKEYYFHKIVMALPRKIQHAIFDFMDTGVDSHDSIEISN